MSLFSRRVDKQVEAYQRELVYTHYIEVEKMYRHVLAGDAASRS